MPGVLFTMRYPDNIGYVWDTIARLRDLAAALLAQQARCLVAYPTLTGQPSYRFQFAEPVALDVYDASAGASVRIAHFVKEHNIKVVVFMSALPNTVNLRLLRALGVRTLNTENNGFDHIGPDRAPVQLIKWLMRSVLGRQTHDLHLANSAAQHRFLASHAKIPARRLRLMEDGVDCVRFIPGDQRAARAATGLQQDWTWIICVSQARPEKRLDAIVRLAQQVMQARPDIPLGFVYVGDGAAVAPCKQLAATLGIADRFHFAGRQSDLVPYYRAADFMVHAAEMESFGLAIVEAMACGRPVIACAAAGPRETIRNGSTGKLVPVNDLEGLAGAVLAYLDAPALVAEHGANARAHVVASYNLQRQADQLAKYIIDFL